MLYTRRWLTWGMLVCCAGCGGDVIEVAGSNPAVSNQPGAPLPSTAPLPAAPAPSMAAAPASAGPVAAVPKKPSDRDGRLPDVPAVLPGDPDEKGPDAFGPEGPPAKREEAKAGVGEKGRGYGGGIITEPIHQKFTIEQRLVFEIQIPKAMQLYKAMHDNQAPKTHEAFMKEIIKANSIALPQLPEGDKYVYDPNLEKLMVQHSE